MQPHAPAQPQPPAQAHAQPKAPAHAPDRTKAVFEILQLLRPHKKALVVGFLAIAGASIASLLEPWPLKLVFDHVLDSRPMEGWVGRLVAKFWGTTEAGKLTFAVIAVIVIAVFGAICTYWEKYLTTSVGQWVMHDLRRTVYFHIQRLSLSFHDQSRTGDLISRVTSDIDAIQSFITSGLLGTLVNILTLFGMIAVMFYINWQFTLIALSVAPILFLVVFFYTRRIKRATKEVRKKEGEIVSVVQEVLTAMRVVKAFAREEYEQQRLEEQSLEGVEIALRARNLKAKLSPLVEIIVAVGTCLILWFGARTVMAGELSKGSLLVFIFYLGKMYKPMQELSKMTDAYTKASVGYDRIRELLEAEREVKDLPRAKNAPRFRGKIAFENVSFSYSPDNPVLKDVTFTVKPGQVAALVGPTGTGKSTVISLIARFYDPSSGVVKIDDVDIRTWKQRSIRQQLSFVLQESILFHAPIWQNIAYGNPQAGRAEILRAAELANAHEFIEQLPEGYDTIVGERGVTLSGGQRQRIAIARAVIRNSPILIMDEPSSGLDAASEKLVFEALGRLMKGKTSIVIAHRLSTVREADVIFVVDNGTIAETGTHDDLLERGGLYAEFYRLQFQTAESDPEVSTAQI